MKYLGIIQLYKLNSTQQKKKNERIKINKISSVAVSTKFLI